MGLSWDRGSGGGPVDALKVKVTCEIGTPSLTGTKGSHCFFAPLAVGELGLEDTVDRGFSIDLIRLSPGMRRGYTASEALTRCGTPWLRLSASRSLSRWPLKRLQKKCQQR